MPITNADFKNLEKDVRAIGERVARLEGVSSVAPPPTPWTRNIILTAVCAAFVAYLGWLGVSVVNQGKDIAVIRQLLAPEFLKGASANPASVESVKLATTILQTARNRQRKFDRAVVSDSGIKFVRVSDSFPPAWGAAVAFLNYQSFLNSDNAPVPPKDAGHMPYAAGGAVIFLGWTFSVPVDLATFPEDRNKPIDVYYTREMTSVSDAALSQPRGFAGNAKATEGNRFIWIDTTAHIVLDSWEMRNVVVRNATIVYRGTPISLKNVYFVNCTFDVVRESQGQAFADAILAQSPSTTFVGL